MSNDYLPASLAGLKDWLDNASAKITADYADLGVSVDQSTTFAGLVSSFNSAYTLAANPDTRNKGTIAARNNARDAVKAYARTLARIIQATTTVTDQMKADLGLKIYDREPSPINPPTEPPVLKVISAIGRTVKTQLLPLDSERRGKPEGVAGASVFSFVGDAPPASIEAYTYQGSTTRTNFDIEFAATVPAGSQVWLCACWYSPRAQTGPLCAPVSCYIAGGVAAAA